MKKNKFKLLNLGCGTRYHKDWINIDFVSNNKNISAYNLLKGIPHKDNTFDVVYHSHLIEHFPKKNVNIFIEECYRVLKPGGIIRIATPNLEEIVKNYVKYLNRSLQNDKIAEFKYDFTMIEMYDQCVRNFTGGEMGKLYSQNNNPISDFIYKRMGIELTKKIDINIKNNFKKNIKKILLFSSKVYEIDLKNLLLRLILGRDFRYYQLGRFRLSGEIHQWMYDRFSLNRLLIQNKFKNVKICRAAESRVSNWNSYNLDTNRDGTVYKPDSIFIEAVK